MTEQELLRERISGVISERGIKAIHIARKTGIDVSFFSRWRHGLKELDDISLDAVKEFLATNHY